MVSQDRKHTYTPSEMKAQRIPNTMLRYVSQYKTIGHSMLVERELLELSVANCSIYSTLLLCSAKNRNGYATMIQERKRKGTRLQ